MTSEDIKSALQEVKYPGFSRDIVSFGLVRGIEVEDGVARVDLAMTTADPQAPKRLQQDVENRLGQVPGVRDVAVNIAVSAPKAPPPAAGGAQQQANGIPGIKYAVAVASGKGGVGKSTFAVNLACALDAHLRGQGKERAVGLLDCDIYGPSVPLMIGLNGRPQVDDDTIIPLENFGIRVMSMGFLIDENAPVVWRGPMIMKAIQQFCQNVRWGELEVLVIDLPPGTGDAQLSLVQTIPLDGAIVITTPQTASVNVARRGAMMFEKVNVPLLGVAENMSYLEGPSGEKTRIFGEGGGRRTAEDLGTTLLGEIPLAPEIREGGDNGVPEFIATPDSAASRIFLDMAGKVWQTLETQTSRADSD